LEFQNGGAAKNKTNKRVAAGSIVLALPFIQDRSDG
jgi:hypothetical protein